MIMLTSYHWRDRAVHWVSDGVLIRETLARVVTIRGDLHVDVTTLYHWHFPLCEHVVPLFKNSRSCANNEYNE
jgi:hypothetical protein